ncbi:MAG: META domain-containing protein [Gemmatimonadaceae bacterium]
MKKHLALIAMTLTLAQACRPSPQPAQDPASVGSPPAANVPPASTISPPDPGTILTNTDWVLVALGARTNPAGAGGRPVTLRIETGAYAIAAGFAGCNRYTGPYSIRGDSITFGPSVSTKMACAEGMDVEQGYLGTLRQVVRYSVADSTLTFFGQSGPLATFRNRPVQ